jgi:AcrR family transcriptional regulator
MSRQKPAAKKAANPPRAAERIRRTANELFYREGIRAVGVDQIVTEAGVTKPSLYRAFPSKDELAAAYLRDFEAAFWRKFDAGVEAHPSDPRAQLRYYLSGLAERATGKSYRGCGMSNAIVEYPDPGHPARKVAEANKHAFRKRLRAMAADMGARDPNALGDALLLLIEGAFLTAQLFGPGGPAASVADAADALIEASLAKD